MLWGVLPNKECCEVILQVHHSVAHGCMLETGEKHGDIIAEGSISTVA